MSLQPYYEESYHTERGRSATELMHEVTTYSKGLFNFVVESKNRFLQNVDWSSLKILEMGAGRGGLGLLLARLGAQVTLVDFSPTALDQAKMILKMIDMFEDLDDVQNVYTNVEFTDEVLEQLDA